MLNRPAYRIFISSTAEDLKSARQLVTQAILQAGHIPLSMESWPATTIRTRDVICDEIRQSDIIVSIVGWTYGCIVEEQEIEEELSYTEFEYRYASELGKPILAFLLDDKRVDVRRSQLLSGALERRFDEQFKQFRNRVKHTPSGQPRLVSYFKNDAQLGIAVASSLQALIHKPNFNAPGLIPADTIDTESGLQELYSTPFIGPTVMRLTGYALLFERVQEQRALKRELAKFFWHYCFPGIWRAGVYRLFFESGSTIAYVAERFLHQTSENRSWKDYWPKVSITTNNILVFLQYLFTSSTVTVELRPQGRPDEKYGATYGPINYLVSYDPGQDDPLDEMTSNVLPNLVKHLLAPGFSHTRNAPSSKLLILAAASGINCTDSPPGPHVGSYRNKIFKRALLMTGAPIVFFVDESKFLEESKLYSPTKCFAVCGEQLTWDQVLKERSIAFCVAASSPEKRSAVVTALHSLGLNWSSSREPRGDYASCLPFLMSNKRFAEDFEGIPLWDITKSGLL
jgi:nucleoside 2-deoxyribosyltransferase